MHRLAAVGLAFLVVSPPAHATALDRAAHAARWLASIQIPATMPADQVAERIASIAAAGATADEVRAALEVISRGEDRAREQGAYAARVVLGLRAVGRDPRTFAGVDWVDLVGRHQDPVTGALDESSLYAHALAGLGLVAGGASVPDGAIRYARANECPDGGFGHRAGCLGGVDTDTTAMMVAFLAAAGGADDVVARGVAAIRALRADDGGFPLSAGGPTNANSTGLAISAIAAATGRGDRDARAALLGLQTDQGGIRYLADSDEADPYATVQAIPGLLGMAYPLEGRSLLVDPAQEPSRPARVIDTRRPDASAPPSPIATGSVVRASTGRSDTSEPERHAAAQTGTGTPVWPFAFGVVAVGAGAMAAVRRRA